MLAHPWWQPCLQMTGSVKYNGKESSEFVVRRTVAYV